jgi:hypothetical protein
MRAANVAKNIEPKRQPAVSNLPMPVSETPLVIDLPDGQKLVVGKMDAGSVIEVATWRGTGRPDSRTSRLMLGMSSSQDAASANQGAKSANADSPSTPQSSETTQSIEKKINLSLPKIGSFSVKLPNINLSILKNIDIKGTHHHLLKVKKKLVAKSKELTPIESHAELDIEQWLTNIKKESEAKVARSRARAASTSAKQTAKKPTPRKTSKSLPRKTK